MKVLLTGTAGLLGLSIVQHKPQDHELVACYHHTRLDIKSGDCKFRFLDISSKESIDHIFKNERPEAVIHTASIGDVNYCDKNPEESWKVNVLGTDNIANACHRYSCRMIFTSTNGIFNGDGHPYSEDDIPQPIHQYGRTKFEAEKITLSECKDACILRLMTMYGWNGPNGRTNPVTWAINQLSNDQTLRVVTDVLNNPLYNKQASDVVWRVLEMGSSGIFHIAGADCVSRYEWIIMVAKVFGFDRRLVTPVESDQFQEMAPRPKNTCFNTGKMVNTLGINPMGIEEGLIEMKKQADSFKKFSQRL